MATLATTSSDGLIVSQFSPPGHLKDFTTKEQEANWSGRVISPMFDSGVKGFTRTGDGQKIINNAPRPQFFNPIDTKELSDLTEKKISWIAFPRVVLLDSPTDRARWEKADSTRSVQDEYCEWSVQRNGDGKITSVQFTCEGPEYWSFLGESAPQTVMDLYQKFINPDIKKEDLFDANGKYMPVNKWNHNTTDGAMHLVQQNNTLGAEVELAAGSSMVREKDGQVLEEQQALIQCGKYGNPDRNSDPLIGATVNGLTRAGAMVALRDPVGLYFDEFSPSGWVTPDASDPKEYWHIERGALDTPVRVLYEVPSDKGFTVGDIQINGQSIEYGAQITDFIQIKLVGIAQNIGETVVEKFGCVEVTPESSFADDSEGKESVEAMAALTVGSAASASLFKFSPRY